MERLIYDVFLPVLEKCIKDCLDVLLHIYLSSLDLLIKPRNVCLKLGSFTSTSHNNFALNNFAELPEPRHLWIFTDIHHRYVVTTDTIAA